MGLAVEFAFCGFLSVLYASAQVTVNKCPSVVPRDQYLRVYGSSCYYFAMDHSREWPTAEQECQARHGHLVTIPDAATNQFLYNTLRTEFDFNGGVVFIGLQDPQSNNVWKWVDGRRTEYTNWASGEPSGSYDCVVMSSQNAGHWQSLPCTNSLFFSAEHRFICEYPVDTSNPTSHPTSAVITLPSITINDCPSAMPRDRYLQTFGSSCYYFILNHAREFATAKQECESRGGHLVIIGDAATNQFLYNTLTTVYHDYADDIYIGLSDTQTPGVWKWVDGSTATYTNWASGEPSGYGPPYDCVVMSTNYHGKWQNLRCQDALFFSPASHKFICEYKVTKPTERPTETTPEAGCPSFECSLDCGLIGYKINDIGCMICECVR